MMANDLIVRPRLNDFYGIYLCQSEVDFAIPFLDEDIPLYIDPFRLWQSPAYQDNGLHILFKNSFNGLGKMYVDGQRDRSVEILQRISECNEVGLGNSKTRCGKRIGESLASNILDVYEKIPAVRECGLDHPEIIQLLVDGISKDRISDITANLLGSFLIDYTIQECARYGMPTEACSFEYLDVKSFTFKRDNCNLPVNPKTKQPLWLVPKRWLRRNMWLNGDDYLNHYLVERIESLRRSDIDMVTYNRENFNVLTEYVKAKERTAADCKNDPLFGQIPITSAKRRLSTIKKLPTGKEGNADKKYEEEVCQLMASLLYPHLDFAQAQSRTESGTQIRDLVFYNNISHPFLKEINEFFGSRQIVVELKNVEEVSKEHINQLNRYLNPIFGSFGIIVTRNRPKKSVFQHTIDLWSGQRKCILIMDDSDVELMVNVFESKQRDPIEVLKMKYIDFTRKCPA
jgi:hypothetical protein